MPLDKFALLRARKAAVEVAEARSAATTDTFAQKIAIREKIAASNPLPQDKFAGQGQPPLTGVEKLRAKVAFANTAEGMEMREVPGSAEIDRICRMQIVEPMAPEELDAYMRENILADAYAGKNGETHIVRHDNGTVEERKGWRLFGLQCEGGLAYDQFNGLFAPIGVGWGKTLITLMCANKAYAKGKKKILLCVPPNVLGQLTQTDIKAARSKIPFNVPVHIVGGKDSLSRRSLTKSGKKGLYILPYSYLSVKDTEEMLQDIRPELIICDEAHNLANRSSARTKRLMAYVDKYGPEGVVLSGTITSKSIRDYFHLIKWCLRDFNPLPNGLQMANEWAAVIDADATGIYGEGGSGRTAQSPLVPLIRWAQRRFAGQQFREDVPSFRRAYKLRMTTAPGVVSSGDASIATSLVMANQPVTAPEQTDGWKRLEELAKKVTDEWLTPNGDEIEHAIHCWKWLNELRGAGFYNELIWPTAEKYADRKKISKQEAEDILKKAVEHHHAGQIYAKCLRKWLQEKSFQGCDTPLLVGHEMSRNGAKRVGAELYELWQDWKKLDFEGRPERDSHAIRICPFKINQAVHWAATTQGNKDKPGGIVWVYHQEAGIWAFDEMCRAGIDAIHCPAGDKFNDMILDQTNKNKIVVASMTAHGTGKNLQHFENNYFLQWPRQAVMAEQTLGRTHRNGQKADELVVATNFTTEFDTLNFAACLNDALYIHQTTGNRQKLIYAVYNPLPKIFPSAVLQERGLEPHMLSGDQSQMLKERFGG